MKGVKRLCWKFETVFDYVVSKVDENVIQKP